MQGLFALVELARLRAEGMAECQMTLASCAAYIRTRVATLMNGPLVSAGAKPGQGRPARLARSNRHGVVGVAGASRHG